MEIRLWTLMYIGATASVLACFIIIYIITTSGDDSIEWMLWIFIGLGFALSIGGFLYEGRSKWRHGGRRVLGPLEGPPW